jgi:hypothetical protein
MANTTQTTATGAAPSSMPPPAPGTGLTAQPASQPVASQPVAGQPQGAVVEQAPRPPAAQPAHDTAAARPGMLATLLPGAIWGPIAMGAAALLQMWSSALNGDQAVRPLRLLTTITGGGANLVDGSVLQGILANVLLGVTFGVLFALIAPRLGGAREILLGALVFGIGIFVVDHYLLARAFPLLDLRDDAFLLASRLVFGAVLAIGFLPGRSRR